MEEKDSQWNKRKEERYDIGLDEKKKEQFCLKNLEQTLIADKLQLPCVVNNISLGGAKITTIEGYFHKDKKVCILLNFLNPIEQITLIGSIRNCSIKTIEKKQIVSILSVKFDEVPIEFRSRLDKFIEKQEE